MIEWFAIPALALGSALIPKRKMSDEKKIREMFENRNVGISKGDTMLFPKLIEKHAKETHSTYVYMLPLGISAEAIESFLPVLQTGLNKDVEVEFDGVLKIKVFNAKLPTSWRYTNELLQEGKWEVPVGKNHEGVIYHDFDKYPHMLVGGVTRFGKTVFIKEIFYSLAMNQCENVDFYILDLKGGMEFGNYQGLPNVKTVASDLLESVQTLALILDDLKKRQAYMRAHRYTNIVDTPIKQRTFVIVDEGAELSPDVIADKELKKYARFCQQALSEIARIGGALGYRLIFCTQYPTKEAVPMQVKMNIVTRISFIAASQIASRVILDEVGAEDLPAIPGRALYQVEKSRTIQVPYIDNKFMFRNFDEKLAPACEDIQIKNE